jgi:tetratricopeptide (TPR) repeat protein
MPSLFRARAAVVDGDLQRAAEDVGRAVSRDPQSARPHVSAGRWLLHTGHTDGAIGEYQRARETKPYVWLPRLVLPRLLADAGRTEEAQQALLEAHALSRSDDPWLALEAAWRELPPPRADEIVLGGLDYGAVRGFMAPESGRWSRRQAWLRLRPLRAAARHAVTLRMGSPEPSPFDAPRVEVRVGRGPWTALTLERGLRDHRLEASAGGDGVILVELRAPVWSLVGKPPELGVFVERLSVAPLG